MVNSLLIGATGVNVVILRGFHHRSAGASSKQPILWHKSNRLSQERNYKQLRGPPGPSDDSREDTLEPKRMWENVHGLARRKHWDWAAWGPPALLFPPLPFSFAFCLFDRFPFPLVEIGLPLSVHFPFPRHILIHEQCLSPKKQSLIGQCTRRW